MKIVVSGDLKGLYRPAKDSHKGQNGRLLVIGGSELFHASIFWAADVASRVVDLVHFSSPAMGNNELVRQRAKEKFWNGIVVPWEKVEEYIEEDDCIVIGPGMIRHEHISENSDNSESRKNQIVRDPENQSLRPSEFLTTRSSEYSEFSEDLIRAGKIDDTRAIVNSLLKKYSHKKWVIDGGALQEVDVNLIPKNAILTPHHGEWEGLLVKIRNSKSEILNKFKNQNLKQQNEELVREFAKRFSCVVVVKGVEDVVCSVEKCETVLGGNEGMTKGGTGDVLAGLIGALYCKNDVWLAATAGSYINKKAGDQLYSRVGPFFNASDLVNEIPGVMKEVWGY